MSFYDAVRRLRSNARVILFCACFCLSSFRPFVRSFVRFVSIRSRDRERERDSRRCETEIRKFLSHRFDTVDGWMAYKFHWGSHPLCARTRNPLNTPL